MQVAFQEKETSDDRYQAQLVAKGYARHEGVDYNEIFSLVVTGYAWHEGVDYNKIFSLVVNYTSIHALLAMIALLDLELEQVDVKTIFLTRWFGGYLHEPAWELCWWRQGKLFTQVEEVTEWVEAVTGVVV